MSFVNWQTLQSKKDKRQFQWSATNVSLRKIGLERHTKWTWDNKDYPTKKDLIDTQLFHSLTLREGTPVQGHEFVDYHEYFNSDIWSDSDND
jgi:hypothetical protein